MGLPVPSLGACAWVGRFNYALHKRAALPPFKVLVAGAL